MPEEINRILTDQLSELLFITERSAEDNLAREGISRDRVHFVGNVMIDTLLFNLEHAVPATTTLASAGDQSLWLSVPRPEDVARRSERAEITRRGQSRKLQLFRCRRMCRHQ